MLLGELAVDGHIPNTSSLTTSDISPAQLSYIPVAVCLLPIIKPLQLGLLQLLKPLNLLSECLMLIEYYV